MTIILIYVKNLEHTHCFKRHYGTYCVIEYNGN